MKQLYILVFFAIQFSFCQNNFIISDGGDIIFQEIKHNTDSISPQEFAAFLQSKSNTQHIALKNNTVTVTLFDMKVNYQKYGGTYLGTTTYLDHLMSGNVEIAFKDDRYRITIRNIKFFDNQRPYAETTNRDNGNTVYLCDYAYNRRKHAIRKRSEKSLSYLSQHFQEFFTYRSPKDW